MRKESDIRKKLRDLRYRYLKRYLEDHLSIAPSNCVHNMEHENSEGVIRLCMLGADDPENWPGNLCDTEENARTCPFFQNRHDKVQLKHEFDARLQDPDVLYNEFRDVAMLQWALDSEVEDVETDLSWWQKFKIWLMRD